MCDSYQTVKCQNREQYEPELEQYDTELENIIEQLVDVAIKYRRFRTEKKPDRPIYGDFEEQMYEEFYQNVCGRYKHLIIALSEWVTTQDSIKTENGVSKP